MALTPELDDFQACRPTVTTVITAEGGRLLVSTEGATTIGLPNCHALTIPAQQIRSISVGTVHARIAHRLGEIIFGNQSSTKSKRRHSTDAPCG